MSCRRAEDALEALLSSCRPCLSKSCLARRPRGARLLSSATSAYPQRPRRRPARRDRHPPRSAVCDARRAVYTEAGGQLRKVGFVQDRRLNSTQEPAKNLPVAPRVAILGGGITGLTAAYYLAQDLPPRSKIVLYEGDSRVGGWVRSERVPVDVSGVKSEVLFERGPRMMSTRGMADNNDRLVMFDLITNTALPFTAGNEGIPRFICHNNSLVPVPTSPELYELLQNPLIQEIGPSALFYYVKNVVLGLSFRNPWEDMSIAEWVQRIFQTPKMNIPLSAMMHGTWGGDIHKLSAPSVLGSRFRTFTAPESGLGDAREARFRYNFASKDRDISQLFRLFAGRQLFFGRHGLEVLPQALADSLSSASNVQMRLGSPVKELMYNGTREQILVRDSKNEPEYFDKVISTLPAHQLAKITGDKLPQLSSFQAATIMTVSIWYPYDGIVPQGLGYLIPDSVPYDQNPERALGVFFDSHVGIGSDGSHKEPGTKVFVLLGGHYYDGVQPPSEGQAVDQAKALLERHLSIPRETPCYATARLARDCLPQHHVGHHANITKLSEQLQLRFDNRLAAAGGSFSKPGVTPAARAGWDVSFAVANEDFLCNGLEDYVEDEFLNPMLIRKEGSQVHLVRIKNNYNDQ